MLYFKVKKEFDNKKKGNNDFYVSNELYTQKEVVKNNLNLNYLEKIELPKNESYFFFGARFNSVSGGNKGNNDTKKEVLQAINNYKMEVAI